MAPRRRAYTLFELILVLALITILAAIGYPVLDGLYADLKIDGAGDALRGAWADAKAHAVEEGRPYRFAVVPGQGNYRVAPDSPEYWSGGDGPRPSDPDNPPLVREDVLPAGILFAIGDDIPTAPAKEQPVGSVDSSTWSRMAVFLPDGTTADDLGVVLGGPGQRKLTLKLRAFTGIVSRVRER